MYVDPPTGHSRLLRPETRRGAKRANFVQSVSLRDTMRCGIEFGRDHEKVEADRRNLWFYAPLTLRLGNKNNGGSGRRSGSLGRLVGNSRYNRSRHIGRPFAIRPIIGEPAQGAFQSADVDVGALFQSPQLLAVIEGARADRRKRNILDFSVSAGNPKQLFNA